MNVIILHRCSTIYARLLCSLCAFAVLSLQVHCAVAAARSASALLRSRCTLVARVAHAHAHEFQNEIRHEIRQFISDQVRSTG